MEKLVSIIIPIYNAQQFIKKTLESIKSQTYKTLEVLMVNDGSTDNTLTILEMYSRIDNRFKIISQVNSGVSIARNTGLLNATGDYITFVDADDYIEKNMIEVLVFNLLETNSDISCCGNLLIRPEGSLPIHGTYRKLIMSKIDAEKELIIGKNIEPSVWSKLFKREVLNNIKFEENIKYNEDYLFDLLSFNNANRIVFYDAPLYCYNLHAGSATTNANLIKRAKDYRKVAEKSTSLFENNCHEIYQLLLLRQYVGYLQQYNSFLYSKNNNDKKYQKELENLIKSKKNNYRNLDLSMKNKFYYYGIVYFNCIYPIIYKLMKWLLPDRRTHKI